MSFWSRGRRTKTWWVCAALGPALVVADVTGQLHRGVANTQTAMYELAMSAAIVAGLWVWAWRGLTRMGPVMYLWPTIWVASDLVFAYPESRVVSTFGLALFGIGAVIGAQMYLSYPTGRLEGRLAWFYVFWMGYVAQVIQNVVDMLYYDGRGCSFCSPQAPTYIHIGSAPFSLDWWNRGWAIQIICVLPIGLYLLYRRYVDAGPGARRTRGPLLVTAVVVTCLVWVQLFLIVLGDQNSLTNVSTVADVGWLAVAITSFLGLAMTRRARGAVADLVVQLGRGGPESLRAALARTIGDPTLAL